MRLVGQILKKGTDTGHFAGTRGRDIPISRVGAFVEFRALAACVSQIIVNVGKGNRFDEKSINIKNGNLFKCTIFRNKFSFGFEKPERKFLSQKNIPVWFWVIFRGSFHYK